MSTQSASSTGLPGRVHAAIAAVIAFAAPSTTLFAQNHCEYEVIAVHVPNQPSTAIYLWDIANTGWAGGRTSDFAGKPVTVSPSGQVSLLASPPGGGEVNCITDGGRVVGNTYPGHNTPVEWIDGVPVPFLADFPISNGYANAANDLGMTAGFVDGLPLPIAGACFWQDGVALPLYETIAGIAWGMDDIGQIAGWGQHPETLGFLGYVWHNGDFQWLPVPPDFTESVVRGMSSNGIVCGTSTLDDLATGNATIWINRVAIDCGRPVGYRRSRAFGVNALGQVVGECEPLGGSGLPIFQFFWQNGEMVPIFTLQSSPFSGTLVHAGGINDRGEICGAGVDANGKGCGIILRPIRSRSGDVTIDCRVDMRDIAALFEFWGKEYIYDGGPGDLDGDRVVGPRDLAMVLADWDTEGR